MRLGRLVADGEGQKYEKYGQSTRCDLPHVVRQGRLHECDLLVMTGGTHTSDRCMSKTIVNSVSPA